jgi:hypothetical protein
MSFRPHATPQYGLAARALVRTLQTLDGVPARAHTLLKFNRDLGDAWFPIYLKLLAVIGQGAPEPDQALLADAVAHGLQHGQTAGGTLGSWGLPPSMHSQMHHHLRSWVPAAPPLASGNSGASNTSGTSSTSSTSSTVSAAGASPTGALAGQGFLRMSAARVLDPLAYLVVWFSQSTSRQPLPAEVFETSLAALLTLFNSSPSARAIYQAKLQGDVAASAEGAFNTTSLLRLRVLVDHWQGATPGAAPKLPAHRIAAAVAQAELRPTRAGLGLGLGPGSGGLIRPV